MSDNRAQGPVLNDDVPKDGAGDQTAAASSGTEKVLGQAGEAVVVERPAPGQSIEIQATAEQTYVLNFSPEQAQVQVQEGHFIPAFAPDGAGVGDRRVRLLDQCSQVEYGGVPPVEVAHGAID